MDYLLLLGGLIGLFAGGEMLVRGAVGVAQQLRIAPFLIGLTVVGFGTSTPELLVSLDAALRGVADIAIGNVVGSNIANILLILGLSALIWPMRVSDGTLRRDTGVMMASALVLVPFFAMGSLTRPAGAILVALLVAYLVWAYRTDAKGVEAEDTSIPTARTSLLWVGAGLVLLMLGARFLVDGAVAVARGIGVSEAFIGLTIVAVGTSLPELATSLVAALRSRSEIAIGNIVGSNIFNVLAILGLTAAITPIPVAERFLTLDLPVMIAVSLALTALLLRQRELGRGIGAAMLAAYVAYLWLAQG